MTYCFNILIDIYLQIYISRYDFINWFFIQAAFHNEYILRVFITWKEHALAHYDYYGNESLIVSICTFQY